MSGVNKPSDRDMALFRGSNEWFWLKGQIERVRLARARKLLSGLFDTLEEAKAHAETVKVLETIISWVEKEPKN